MKIFSGSSNLSLANLICKNLSINLGEIKLHSFPSGEKHCQFLENIRGSDVFLIQSGNNPSNDNLMELLIMSDAARRASAGRITAVIPYFFYARQDRKEKSRVPISAKLVLNMIEAAGFDRILTMDLHAAQIGGMTDLPLDHLYFMPALLHTIKDLPIDVFVAPDVGAIHRNNEYARCLKKPLAIIDKRRLSDTEVEVSNFIGDVNGKNVLIVDDLTESGKTLIEAGEECRKRGAVTVRAAITHPCFSNDGHVNIFEAFRGTEILNGLFYSNSVAVPPSMLEDFKFCEGMTEVDVSPIFARAIRCIHENQSVSELFNV